MSRFRNAKSPTKVGTLNAVNLKSLRGDLDNIVMMSLRKEPQRRYASAEQFSEDIRRYLEGLPVIACKATLSYRASKFVQRNKIGVAAAAIILLTLIGGIIATGWETHRARVEQARAELRFNEIRGLVHAVVFDYHDAIASLPGSRHPPADGRRASVSRESTRRIGELSQSVGGLSGTRAS